ncbi:MAG: sulfide-dependent adenosine diphosphate thiazole synthase [Candidatus Omnitrophica bacterium]|nr:sulfide-dependent adenosine diphosphate thiazole synthase [Candidatus Omnitrophota bacterium]
MSEKDISLSIVKDFYEKFCKVVENDVVVVGGGPSGLIAAREIAKDGLKVLIIERNNYLGGGFWIGGYLMNGVTFREQAKDILDEIGIPYKKVGDGLFITDGPVACSRLIYSTCEKKVTILNMTNFEDIILKDGRVRGVVVNWTPVSGLPREITCVDPIGIETKIVIDATGHDAIVARNLEKRGLIEMKGFGPMNVEESEYLVVEMTGEIYPGVIVCGMAVSTVYGLPRMGPTFGSMFLSGKKAGKIAKDIIFSKEFIKI